MFCSKGIKNKKPSSITHNGKAADEDVSPADVCKAGRLPLAEKLTELFHCMWRKEAIPQEFKDAFIIHLFKKKENPQTCDNQRGISLIATAGKILDKLQFNRLSIHLGQTTLVQESHSGFRELK